MLTTEECLLSPVQARNPGLSETADWRHFPRLPGRRRQMWLRSGIAGDDTHGHMDDLARFVDRKNRGDRAGARPQRSELRATCGKSCAAARNARPDGLPLRVESFPCLSRWYFAGQRLPASYANFYIANRLVLVPTFNDPNDRVALNALAGMFPDREVIGICVHGPGIRAGYAALHDAAAACIDDGRGIRHRNCGGVAAGPDLAVSGMRARRVLAS